MRKHSPMPDGYDYASKFGDVRIRALSLDEVMVNAGIYAPPLNIQGVQHAISGIMKKENGHWQPVAFYGEEFKIAAASVIPVDQRAKNLIAKALSEVAEEYFADHYEDFVQAAQAKVSNAIQGIEWNISKGEGNQRRLVKELSELLAQEEFLQAHERAMEPAPAPSF